MKKLALVVLISGRGSNLQALLDQQLADNPHFYVKAVISNRPDAMGLQGAEQAGVQSALLDHKTYTTREDFDQDLGHLIDQFQPDLIILAGFMRILTPAFVRKFNNRMINLHPSLLPKYPGLNTHQRALDAGDSNAGASIHLVTEELDGGPVIMQSEVEIEPDETASSLAAKILPTEHEMLIRVVEWFSTGAIKCQNDQVLWQEGLLDQPIKHSQYHSDQA